MAIGSRKCDDLNLFISFLAQARKYSLASKGLERGEPYFITRTTGTQRDATIVAVVEFKDEICVTSLDQWNEYRSATQIKEGASFDWNGTTPDKMYLWQIGKVRPIVPQPPPVVKGIVNSKPTRRMCRFDDGLDDHSTKAFPITTESSHYFWSLGESEKLRESDDDKALEATQRSATLEAAEIQRQQQEEHAEQMRRNTEQPEQAALREEAEANEQGERHAAAKRDDQQHDAKSAQMEDDEIEPPQVDPVQKCKSLNELTCAQKCCILPTEWMDQAAKGPTVIFDPALLDLCLEDVGHFTCRRGEARNCKKYIFFAC